MTLRNEKAERWRVHGKVQGVSFRWFTRQAAEILGVRGWVRNRSDGTVEIAAAGSVDRLAALRARVGEGPRWADVERVDERPLERSETMDLGTGFEIRH